MNGCRISFFVILSMFLSSCTEILDLDPDQRFVVVHGILVNEPQQTILLHYSSYLSDNYQEPINVGQVFVEEENDDSSKGVTYTFTPKGDGRWVADFTPQVDKKYNLIVKIPGEKEITASTVFPTNENLLFLQMEEDGYTFHTRYIPLYLWVYGMDYNAGTGQFNMPEYIYGNDYFESADEFNCSHVTIQNCAELQNTTTAKFTPDALLRYGYVRYVFGVQVDQPPLFVTSKVVLNVLPAFRICENGFPHPESKVIFDSVSPEYDQYIKSVISLKIKEINESNQDFSSLYDYEQAASNIQNGVGVFGAVYRSSLRINYNHYIDN